MRRNRQYRLHPDKLALCTDTEVKESFAKLMEVVADPKVILVTPNIFNETVSHFAYISQHRGESDRLARIFSFMLSTGLMSEVIRRSPKDNMISRRSMRNDLACELRASNSAPTLRTSNAGGNFGHLLAANYCERCKTDTAHKGYQCLICGHNSAPVIPRHEGRVSRTKGKRLRRAYLRVAGDRRQAQHRSAEASRQKFEKEKPKW